MFRCVFSLLVVSASTLSISSTPIQVCLHCKIIYFGIIAADTGTGRGVGYLHPRHQLGPTRPHLQNPVSPQEPSSLFIQLQAVLEQHDLILIILSIMSLTFHSADLWPWDLRMHVQEQALSHHVAGLATSEAGVQHSRG